MRNWSESAAIWAVRLWPSEVGAVFCEWRVHDIAILYTYSMLPEKIGLILCLMVAWMDWWYRWVEVEGARTNMSRWKRIHQKGVELIEFV